MSAASHMNPGIQQKIEAQQGSSFGSPDADEEDEDDSRSIESQARKARKPYTITKQRENWTDEEHQKFLEALKLFDRDWKKIENFIGTKTVIQIRSHAQKYFMKVQKSGNGDRIPPPRPKKKSSQPYPQKPKPTNQSHGQAKQEQDQTGASETVSVPWLSNPENVTLSQCTTNPAAFAHWMATNGLMPGSGTPNFNATQALKIQHQQQEQLAQAQHFLQEAMMSAQHKMKITQQESQQTPNFAKIYSFLGSLFDPSATSHVEALNDMSPIHRESIQLLMHNLALNIANQQFREQHAFLLDQYHNVLSKQGASGYKTLSTPSISPSSLNFLPNGVGGVSSLLI